MLIRIEKDWTFPELDRQSPANSGVWGDLQVTYDPVPVCDLLLVLNSPNRDIRVRCPAGNRWLFSQESPTEMYRWHRDSFKYFDKVFTFWEQAGPAQLIHNQTALPWHIGKSYDQLTALTLAHSLPVKRDAVSWITSAATHKEGHKLRMAFKDYLQAQNFNFDLWGRGFNPIDDKFDGLHPYKYSIAIENHGCNDYWTEKIADCFLSWTIPIYWGAKNILSYFPANSMLLIDPSDGPGSMAKIRDALANDFHGKNTDALAEARDLVLNRYQMFPHLAALVKEHVAAAPAPRVQTFMPAHPMHYRHEPRSRRVMRLAKRLIGRAV